MSLIIRKFEDKDLSIYHSDDKEFFMRIPEIASALGVGRTAIHNVLNRNSDEFIEGIDWDTVTICDGTGRRRKNKVIYKIGIIKVTFLVKSGKAKAFRQFAANILLKLANEEATLVSSSQIDELQTLIYSLQEDLSSMNQKYQLLENQYRQLTTDTQQITQVERDQIRKRVDALARKLHQLYRTPLTRLYPDIWKSLHVKFKVKTYTDIRRDQVIPVIMDLEGRLDTCHLIERERLTGAA